MMAQPCQRFKITEKRMSSGFRELEGSAQCTSILDSYIYTKHSILNVQSEV
jgi:hypothetical protein